MKIAFTAKGKDWNAMIDARFGHAEFIVIYDDSTNKLIAIDNSLVKDEDHWAKTSTSKSMFEIDPDVLITGHIPNENISHALKISEIKIYVGAEGLTLKQAWDQYKKGSLKEI